MYSMCPVYVLWPTSSGNESGIGHSLRSSDFVDRSIALLFYVLIIHMYMFIYIMYLPEGNNSSSCSNIYIYI